MVSWFSRPQPRDIWDDPVEQPLGDIEAAQRIRLICRDAAGCAATIGASHGHSSTARQRDRERYERAARVAMEIAMKVSDGLVRDASVREIVGLCMKANNTKTARTLYRAIQAKSIKAEVLKDHPTLGVEQDAAGPAST
jgi:hypothetical protein